MRLFKIHVLSLVVLIAISGPGTVRQIVAADTTETSKVPAADKGGWSGSDSLGVIGVDWDSTEAGIYIQTAPGPEYALVRPEQNTLILRVENALQYDLSGMPAEIWRQFDIQDLSIYQRYQNFFIKLIFDTSDPAEFHHIRLEEGIRLTFPGIAPEKVQQYLLRVAPEEYSSLNTWNRVKILSLFNNVVQDCTGTYLQQLMNTAADAGESAWFRIAANALEAKGGLTADHLRDLALRFENRGEQVLADSVWYRYYQTMKAGSAGVYLDTLPDMAQVASAAPALMKNGESGSPEPKTIQAGAWYWYVLGGAGLLAVLTGMIYLLRSAGRNAENREPVFHTEQPADFLAALQVELEKEEKKPDRAEAPQIAADKQGVENRPDDNPVERASQEEMQQKKETPEPADETGVGVRKRLEVQRLARNGFSVESIAKELHLSTGEVELLLRISEKSRQGKTGRSSLPRKDLEGLTIPEIAKKLKISEEEAKLMQMRQ